MSTNHQSSSSDGLDASRNADADNRLAFGRRVLLEESRAIADLAGRLGDSYLHAADLILTCRGSLLVSGMGKAGLIGQKIAATFASTGTPSHFLHPAEAIHGDLGRIGPHDVILVLSYSGETEEITRVIASFREQAAGVIAMTGRQDSQLATQSDIVLNLGEMKEACSLGLAPSTSTAAMLALGDALALLVSHLRGFEASDFARFHPGGSLGRKLLRVDEVMRPLSECRVGNSNATIREVLVSVGRPGRRTGAIMLVDDSQMLRGIFTDSDLARLLERQHDNSIDQPIDGIMTKSFQTVASGSYLSDAVDIISRKKISELPVVDPEGQPLGLVDITDVLSLVSSDPPIEQNMSPDMSPLTREVSDTEFQFDDLLTEVDGDDYPPRKPRTPKRLGTDRIDDSQSIFDDEPSTILRIVRPDDEELD